VRVNGYSRIGLPDGLVAQPVIAMNVGIEDGNHRLVGNAPDHPEYLVADLDTAARIDQHNTVFRHHEPGIVHESPRLRTGKRLRAVYDIDVFGQLLCRELRVWVNGGGLMAVAVADTEHEGHQGQEAFGG